VKKSLLKKVSTMNIVSKESEKALLERKNISIQMHHVEELNEVPQDGQEFAETPLRVHRMNDSPVRSTRTNFSKKLAL